MLIIFNLFFFASFLVSLFQVMKEKNKCIFIYPWAFFIYAFVWEDLMIISLFFLGLINLSVFFHDARIALLGAILFYCVRSAGETLYYFLQQFHQPKHHPHDIDYHFDTLRKILGPISYQKSLIILQVVQQMSLTCALTALTVVLINWNNIPTLW
jgi:hypothetical protein